MIKYIQSMFSRPTAETLSENTLADAKIQLLEALNVLDTYEGKVMGLRKTIARLESTNANTTQTIYSPATMLADTTKLGKYSADNVPNAF